jgi:hypothetical protein
MAPAQRLCYSAPLSVFSPNRAAREASHMLPEGPRKPIHAALSRTDVAVDARHDRLVPAPNAGPEGSVKPEPSPNAKRQAV